MRARLARREVRRRIERVTSSWPPLTTALCRPDEAQLIDEPGDRATVTGSLNVTVRLVLGSTFVASAAGVVLTTDGAASAGVATVNEKT